MSDDRFDPPRTPGDSLVGGLSADIPRDSTPQNPFRSRRPPGADDTNDDPTPALACLDCEVVWTDPDGRWAYCPQCGAELDEWEVADE